MKKLPQFIPIEDILAGPDGAAIRTLYFNQEFPEFKVRFKYNDNDRSILELDEDVIYQFCTAITLKIKNTNLGLSNHILNSYLNTIKICISTETLNQCLYKQATEETLRILNSAIKEYDTLNRLNGYAYFNDVFLHLAGIKQCYNELNALDN